MLLCDDHALFRQGIKGVLDSQTDFQVVGEAEDGRQAVELARELMPDLILMDLNMPGLGGLEATRLIKREMPAIKVVILTVSDEEENLLEAIKSGAQGYLLKNLKLETFLDFLRGVFRGEAPISPLMAGKILGEFARLAAKPAEVTGGDELTDRETEVLSLVARGSTNREIATALFISENTVKKHLQNILEKLHLQNRVQAAAFALRQGLGREKA